MDISSISHIITLVVAPVVMISCCVLFLNGQLQRYDAISSRMRMMIQERFDLLHAAGENVHDAMDAMDDLSDLRLREIEAQLPHLLKRHKMIHSATLILGLAILAFVLSMFVLALASILNSSLVALVALLTFLAGMIIVLSGGMMIMYEIYNSHLSIRYEVLHALSLGKNVPSLTRYHRRIHSATPPLVS